MDVLALRIAPKLLWSSGSIVVAATRRFHSSRPRGASHGREDSSPGRTFDSGGASEPNVEGTKGHIKRRRPSLLERNCDGRISLPGSHQDVLDILVTTSTLVSAHRRAQTAPDSNA